MVLAKLFMVPKLSLPQELLTIGTCDYLVHSLRFPLCNPLIYG